MSYRAVIKDSYGDRIEVTSAKLITAKGPDARVYVESFVDNDENRADLSFTLSAARLLAAAIQHAIEEVE